MRARGLLVACLLTFSTLCAVGPPARADPACTNVSRERRMSNAGIGLTQSLGLPSGKYAVPLKPPTQLVVMLHGYGNDSCSWRNHLRRAVAHGAAAFAMDYTGQHPRTNRGWRVLEGANDSIKATKYFLRRYPSIKEVFVFGISMGGNTSGMLVAHPEARRGRNGKPLFDYWVVLEGVHNLAQEYATFSQVSAEFREDVEQEAGGPPWEVPDRYRHLSNVVRADEMAYLKGAVLVHGADDLLVQYNQSRDMAKQLRRVGVPTELYTVAGRGDGESGTTISGLAVGSIPPASALRYESPFAGHAWEGSDTHLVNRLGLDQLWKVMAGKIIGPYREVVVHGEGLRVPAP